MGWDVFLEDIVLIVLMFYRYRLGHCFIEEQDLHRNRHFIGHMLVKSPPSSIARGIATVNYQFDLEQGHIVETFNLGHRDIQHHGPYAVTIAVLSNTLHVYVVALEHGLGLSVLLSLVYFEFMRHGGVALGVVFIVPIVPTSVVESEVGGVR